MQQLKELYVLRTLIYFATMYVKSVRRMQTTDIMIPMYVTASRKRGIGPSSSGISSFFETSCVKEKKEYDKCMRERERLTRINI